MRIVVAHNYYQQGGGEDQCVAQEVELLRDFGHDALLFSLRNDSINGMGRAKLASATIWNRAAYAALRAVLRAHQAEVAHFHNTFPLISPAGYYAARAEGAKVVQTLHNYRLACANALLLREGQVCESCLGSFAPWKSVGRACYRDSRAASAVATAMLGIHRAAGTWRSAVDVYLALTEFGRRKFIATGLPAGRLLVKPNFVSPDPGPGAGSGGFGIFVGRLSEEKGVHVLLQAWRRLDGAVPLWIIGDGPLAPLVRDAAQRDPAIRWLGKLPLSSVYQIIGDAAFAVLPSICFEAFPRVIAEAFAKGTPVVASRAGAMAELVEDGRTGALFSPGDPDDLARVVRGMEADVMGLARMRGPCRAEFEAKYTAEANHRCLMDAYRLALTGGRADQAA